MEVYAFDAVIVGGGPAGAVTAAVLASLGHRVVLVERASGTRGRLCGEFLSPDAVHALRQIGFWQAPAGMPHHRIERIRVVADTTVVEVELDPPGWGIAREVLDERLLQFAQMQGAEVLFGWEVYAVEEDGDARFRVHVRRRGRMVGMSLIARTVIGAFGRKSGYRDPTSRRPTALPMPYVAFQQHVCPSSELWIAPTVLQLTFIGEDYLGVAAVGEGRWNVCGITHVDTLRRYGKHISGLMNAFTHRSGPVSELVQTLTLADHWRVVTYPHFGLHGLHVRNVLMVGDAAATMPPFCGDGIAMAIHSGILAAESLDGYLRGRWTRTMGIERYVRAWRVAFERRMDWALRLDRWLQRPWVRNIGFRLLRWAPRLLDSILWATRGRTQ